MWQMCPSMLVPPLCQTVLSRQQKKERSKGHYEKTLKQLEPMTAVLLFMREGLGLLGDKFCNRLGLPPDPFEHHPLLLRPSLCRSETEQLWTNPLCSLASFYPSTK